MKKIYLLLIFSVLLNQVYAQTTTFSYTGSIQTYTVPAGVSLVSVDAKGGCGGGGYISSGSATSVALGGRVQCNLSVTPGQVLYISVGGGITGFSWYTTAAGGFNGGGSGGSYANGGGGATDIRLSSGTVSGNQVTPYTATNRIIVAGGGGGGGDFSAAGGLGGGLVGGTGGVNSYGFSGTAGSGGTQTGPGPNGFTGSAGVGGNGSSYSGGGGGGGLYGGNGANYYNGGGGGSSYTDPVLCSSVTHTQGYSGANGNGQVVITVLCNPPGTITGTLTVCNGSTTTLSDPTSISGGTWISSNPSVATVGSSTGIVTGVSVGTAVITYQISTPCGSSAMATVTVNPVPGSITGTLSGCPSGTATLSASPSGGSWSSSNTSIANINSSTGVITDGTSTGTATITYSLGNGCSVSTATYSVNPNPSAITGTAVVCGGTGPTTTTLSDATSGGTWSSSNTSLATVGSTGIVTGGAAGTPTISYTLPTGCSSTIPVTVNAVPSISGSSTVCQGSTTTLSDATSGGVWTSVNTSVATIGSGTGVVSGLTIGSSTISYFVSSLNCSALMTMNVSTSSPTVFSVTGGGSYCSGGAGVHVGLNGSNTGVTYSLFNGATLVATATGTGSSVDFGPFTGSGSYTVIANYGTSCATSMSGSATISINSLPTSYSVGGSGSYCSGGSGVHVTLNSSTVGVNYQLMLGSTPIGSPIAGTGGSLDFGPQTTAGTYTVVATNASTSCISTMSGSATVSISALPTAFSVTGGGGYCLGGSGVHVGLSGSISGTTYQLLLGGAPVGSPLSGTGSSLDFGLITTGGTYTVQATNSTTGCSGPMSGSTVVTVNSLPTAFSVTGGGSYCSGGSGVSVGLNSSTAGVNYQLFLGTTPLSTVAGTGASISFGSQTSAGSYTVVATNATTGCVNNMTGSASISITALPTSFSLTGGGSYCAGGSGLPVGLSGSVSGTTYSLFNGTTLVGAASGTGLALSFGPQLAAGVYTVTALNSAGCTGNMSGSVTITINPLPSVFTMTGGGNYCAGGTGVAVGLSGSTSGVSYQLYNGTTVIGSPVAGSGGTITFGSQTAAGSYTVIANNTSTGCTNNMLGSSLIVVNPLPTTYALTGGGAYCVGATGPHVGLASSNTGISYQLTNSGTPVGSAVAGTGAALDFGTFTASGTYQVTATNPSTGCVAPMSGSSVVTINALPTPYAVINGGSYCAGGTGVHVGLANSTSGINYQLFNGTTPVGGAVPGTGSSIDFGLQTAAGTYVATATNASTGCANNMTGSAAVTINPLPALFAVTGTGTYCAGSTGLHVGLSGSASGIDYQLMNGAALVTTVSGTGGALDFGALPAGVYTIVASNTSTACTNNMSGTALISVNPAPAVHNITGGGGYCTGGTGVHVGLNGSDAGMSYQLYSGLTPVGSPVSGTGLPVDFGLQTSGNYTAVATNATTGCSSTMTGSATVNANPLPVLHSVSGGGSYCAGGSGVSIGLDGSNTGTNYQLFNGSTAVGSAVPGSTGVALNFGPQTTPGIYTVVATNTATSCSTAMSGSTTVAVNPLPIAFNVTGGGNYCSGGAGVHVGLSGSASGMMYQLWNGTATAGPATPGTGSSIDFGAQTTPGTYTVTARDIATACTSNMTGTASVVINPLPALHVVTGGGDYCTGGSGVHVGLDASNAGANYQLLNGVTPVGTATSGTGSPLDFGLQTSAGTYTVMATNVGTGCAVAMSSSANVVIDPLPNPFTVVGGGSYCSGGTGVTIALNASDPGVSYQLFAGTAPAGAPVSGTGAVVNFGVQTLAGTYSVVATDPSTSCSSNMSNTVAVTITALPTAFAVGGGGNYCMGGAGSHITLAGSTTGVTYQLWEGGVAVGTAMSGTGSAIDFGPQTLSGVYTVKATNGSTSCVNTMAGSAIVGINPLPVAYTLTSIGSSFCSGGTGVDVGLSSSDAGVTYQLYNAGSPVGSPVPGTGGHIDFGNQTGGGSYVAVATNTAGCTNNMTGLVNIIVNPLPAAYTVTGGGGYCTGSAGVHVGLAGSDVGITYSLYRSGTLVGTTIGTSGAVDFGLQTTAGAYTVVATNTATGCTNNMSGAVSVAVNPLPVSYAVSGGGSYCAGGSGVHVGMSTSTLGVDYQLYRGGLTPVGSPVSGSGGSIDFGAQTVPGTYTVVATNSFSGCSTGMGGGVSISINAAPAAYSVTGGGSFCSGGTGVHVGLSNSVSGISYQLYNGLSFSGSAVPGSGAAIDFGVKTTAGSYTVIATNTSTGCTASMSGSATVNVNSLPAPYSVAGGGSYCAGGIGVHVGLANSAAGVNYSLMNGTTPVATLGGTSGPLDFGLETAAGTYTVHAVNVGTGCAADMPGSATVTVTPVAVPSVAISNGGSDSVCEGSFIVFTANAINGGLAPSYQWSVNGVIAGSGSTYGYIPINGDVVSVTVTSSAACASPTSANASVSMTVDPTRPAAISVSADPGNIICQGTSVTFTATPSYGGDAPVYTWYKNGVVVGTSAPTYSYTPANGDVVYSTLLSNYHCASSNSASSTHISMEVDLPGAPVVNVVSDQGLSVAAGQTVRFTATATNGGPTPSYQWEINSNPVPGATSSVYTTNTLFDGDVVSCVVTRSGGCAGTQGSDALTMHIRGVGVTQIANSGADVKLLPNPSKGAFTVRGTLSNKIDEDVNIEITDMLGKVIYSGKTTSHNGEINERIDMGSGIANGMYILTLHSGAESLVFHVVVEQ